MGFSGENRKYSVILTKITLVEKGQDMQGEDLEGDWEEELGS